MTERMPDVVEAVRALPVDSVVLDGEAIALRDDGRPRRFQETASRAARRGERRAPAGVVRLTPFFFDVLHLDGRDLLDLPGPERYDAIAARGPRGAVGAAHRDRRRRRGGRRSTTRLCSAVTRAWW